MIGNSVTSIASNMFYGCSSLDVTIGNSVTSIEDKAFYECGLKSVTIGNSVTSIGNEAFYECGLKSVTIPKSVATIGCKAFGYERMSSIIFEDTNDWYYTSNNDYTGGMAVDVTDTTQNVSNLNYSSYYWYKKQASHINIANMPTKTSYFTGEEFNLNGFEVELVYSDGSTLGITVTPDMVSGFDSSIAGTQTLTVAYRDYTTTFEVEVKNLTATSDDVMDVIENLSDGVYTVSVTGEISLVTLSNIKAVMKNKTSTQITLDLSETTGLTSIHDSAFKDCGNLSGIIIPDSVTSIGNNAFENCSRLTKVELPNSATAIGSYAFSRCGSLKSVIIPDGVTSIGDYAFTGCSYDNFINVTIPGSVTSIGNNAFSECYNLQITVNTDDKYLYSDDGTKILLCDSSVVNIEISDSVTSIAAGAFSHCRNVETIVTGNGLTSLSGLPKTSKLKSITIGDGVTSISSNAFSGCRSLTNVTIGDSVTSIGDSAFYNCSSLTNVTIPDNVTSIGSNTFSGCSSLTSVTIGNSVTSIGSNAFSGCNSLRNVTFMDTSTWYYTGETEIDVTNTSNNAAYLRDIYSSNYWYKE